MKNLRQFVHQKIVILKQQNQMIKMKILLINLLMTKTE
jgi:hypothetical protein